jgi:hypothetical protein
MNRDVYSVILRKAKHVLRIRLLNVTQKWEDALVHEDVVKGYGCCKCVLLCTRNANPEKQLAPRIIDTWDRLLDIHHTENTYRLLPMRANGPSAFAVLQGITSTPGSPFSIDHRSDFVPYRCTLGYKSPVRAAADKCFRRLTAQGLLATAASSGLAGANAPLIHNDAGHLPIMGVDFDGVLKTPGNGPIGLVVVRPGINPASILHFANMMKFVESPEFFTGTGLDPVPWRDVLGSRERFLFLAGEATMPIALQRQMALIAQRHKIHLYHKMGHEFVYVPPE